MDNGRETASPDLFDFFYFSYKELESEIIFRYRNHSSLSLLVMVKFEFKRTLENGLTNPLNSNISDTYKDIELILLF